MSRILIILTSFLAISCGDPTDRPEDCTSNEFFDELRKQCRTCAAVPQPNCEDGCSFAIVEDPQTGCPAAECLVGDDCAQCGDTEFFASDTLTCEACDGPQTCADDESPQQTLVDGRCVLTCP